MDADTVVDLLRHGEPVGGTRIRGQSDDPLSDRGWEQMWRAVGELAPWQVIVTSPLRRCAAFAQALAGRHGLPLEVEPRFKEIGFGEWEGLTPEDVARRDPDRYARFRDDPQRFMPPGAEEVAAFAARIGEAWQSLLDAHAGRRVLVVCHAGTIRAVLGQVLGAPPSHLFRARVDYAGLTRIERRPPHAPVLVAHAAPLA